MPKNVTQYDLLISCPSDIKDEIQLIEKAVDQFNTQFSDTLGISIRIKHWRKNSYAQSGGKPQALLNEQFVNECDAAVAVLWTRFGTPTDQYDSGTEEEIEIMLEAQKQVFMYFSDKQLPPSQIDSNEYEKVKAFREKYKGKGIYFSYSSDEELKSLLFAHLSQYFLSAQKIAEIIEERQAILRLVGIDEQQHLVDAAKIIPFVPKVEKTTDQYIQSICDLCNDIAGIAVGKGLEHTHVLMSLKKPAVISENDREHISTVAQHLEICLPDDFFNLGNLSQSTIPTNIYGGTSIEGTDEEEKKYAKIMMLKKTIYKLLEWSPVENAFSGKRCIKLALQNCGTAVDEDVEIGLKFSKKCLITLSDFPKFNNDEMGYLLNDCDMGKMFGICATADYIDYASSQVERHFSPLPISNVGLPGYVPNYSDSYISKLNDVFCYSVYERAEDYIIKLKIDYIKHNTTIAFPTIILIPEPFDTIDYTITSKDASDIVTGQIEVKE